jgi:hypothetical protein
MWQEIYNYYELLGKDYDWTKQKIFVKNNIYNITISNRLTQMIDDIATKMGYRPNFLNYSYLDEMRGDARTKMFKAIRDCSFKCYTTAKIVKEVEKNGEYLIHYYDKKGKLQAKPREETDVYETLANGDKMITFRANAFGYYSRIASHAFLNRIKKEKLIDETKKAFQCEVWERMLATENFQSVRRPKTMTDYDENEAVFEMAE